MKNYLKLLIILPVLFFSIYSQAQSTNFTKGHIITVEGEKTECYVMDKEKYNAMVKYKLNQNDKKTKKIDHRKLSQLKGKNTFDRIKYNNEFYFIKNIVDGPVKLYSKPRKNKAYLVPNTNYAAATSLANGYKRDNDYYLVKGTQVYKLGNANKFKHDLRRVLTGQNQVIQMINQLNYKTLDSTLANVVRRYNDLNKIQNQ